MANIKYGSIAEEVAGSIGGVTFARSYTGKIARGWRAPTNKRTTRQLDSRAYLAAASANWRSPGMDPWRAGWDSYADTCPFTNSLGEIFYLNGFNTYVRHDSIFLANLASHLYEPPLAPGFPSPITLSLQLVHATGNLSYTDWSPAPAGTAYFFFNVNTIRSITRVYPYRASIGTTGAQGTDTPPYTIWPYLTPLPYTAGRVHALLVWQLFDESRRLSKCNIDLVASS